MKKYFLVLISIFTTASAIGQSFCWSNVYLDGFTGVNFVNNGVGEAHINLKTGYALGAAMGYRFTRFFCLEAEGSFRENRISALHFDDAVFVTSGHLYSISAICNGILEVPLLRNGLIPYVGFGLGHQWEHLHFIIDPVATQEGFYIFDSCLTNSYGLAYQGIIGMTFMKRQKFQIGGEYRFLNQFHTVPGNHTLDMKLKWLF